MSTPGSNLLAEAVSVIGTQEFFLYQWDGSSDNAAGRTVQTYKPRITISASIQAVSRSVYKNMGLNFKSKYLAIWSVQDVKSLSRLQSNDQIGFLGRRFNILSEDDWTPIDLWNNFVAVDISEDLGDAP